MIDKQLICQVPIVRGAAPKCTNKAVCYDRWGWVYCEEHDPGEIYRLKNVEVKERSK